MVIAVVVVIVLFLILLLYLFCLAGGERGRFDALSQTRYAHRGLHNIENGIPENSLKAFRLAVENGYGAELDVHLSKDGKLVVMHDESLQRTAKLNKNISDCTKEELDALTLENTEEKIPYLEEVLPLFEGNAPLIVELKAVNGNHAVLSRKTCAMLRQYPNLQFCIESFDPRVLIWLRKNQSSVIRGQLSCNFLKERNGLVLPVAFALTFILMNFLTRPHFIAVRYEDKKLPSVRLCKKLWGIAEVNWTLRTPEDADAAINGGATVIFEKFKPNR